MNEQDLFCKNTKEKQRYIDDNPTVLNHRSSLTRITRTGSKGYQKTSLTLGR